MHSDLVDPLVDPLARAGPALLHVRPARRGHSKVARPSRVAGVIAEVTGSWPGAPVKKSIERVRGLACATSVPCESSWTNASVTMRARGHRMKWDTGRAIRLLGPGWARRASRS